MKRSILVLLVAALGPLTMAGAAPAQASTPAVIAHHDGYGSHRHHPRHQDDDGDDGPPRCRALIAICLL